MRRLLPLVVLGLIACKSPRAAPVDAGPAPVVSQAILNRPVQTTTAVVRHIVIGWADLASNYGPGQRMDERAKERDKAAAAELVRSILSRLASGEDFGALEKQFSEDVLSAQRDETFEVHPDAQFEPQFQALALRLNVGEIGVCQSSYGFHVVQRLK